MALERPDEIPKRIKTGTCQNDEWCEMAISSENQYDPVKLGLSLSYELSLVDHLRHCGLRR